MPSKYVLISVYNKRGIAKLAKFLLDFGYKIIATDGTGQELKKHKIPFISCQKISRNPKCFDGFMKTMSFSIESGMLFDRANHIHIMEAKKFNVKNIDIVICNFFPVKKIINLFKFKSALDTIRYFDFGGPTMVRVAAQNFKNVLVIVDPNDYKKIQKSILLNQVSHSLKYYLAKKAFYNILDYDKQIIQYMNNHDK